MNGPLISLGTEHKNSNINHKKTPNRSIFDISPVDNQIFLNTEVLTNEIHHVVDHITLHCDLIITRYGGAARELLTELLTALLQVHVTRFQTPDQGHILLTSPHGSSDDHLSFYLLFLGDVFHGFTTTGLFLLAVTQ